MILSNALGHMHPSTYERHLHLFYRHMLHKMGSSYLLLLSRGNGSYRSVHIIVTPASFSIEVANAIDSAQSALLLNGLLVVTTIDLIPA